MNRIRTTFIYWLADIRYRYAVSLAERAHNKRRVRCYVVPDERDRLIVIDRRNFRAYKRRGQIVQSATVADLKRDSIYYTADGGGNNPLCPEDREFKRRVYLYSRRRKIK